MTTRRKARVRTKVASDTEFETLLRRAVALKRARKKQPVPKVGGKRRS